MTYSILARDPATGELGGAVQSHYFGTGRLVLWAEAGIGAVATQSIPEIAYGPRGLDGLRLGHGAKQTLAELVADDPMDALRQVAIVDATGCVAVHTGTGCVREAGHATGEAVSAQANMMAKPTVWAAMLTAFELASGDLAGRLLTALEAAEAEGGDIRGQQSAAMLTVSGERSERPWDHKRVDLRVDDHASPLSELRRLVEYDRAFALVARVFTSGLLFAPVVDPGATELDWALNALATAQQTLSGNYEPTFWQAVLLAKAGLFDDAQARLNEAARNHRGWYEFLTRLPAAGLLADNNELLTKVPKEQQREGF